MSAESPRREGPIGDRFTDLSTPLVADACLRLGIEGLRMAAPAIRPLLPGMKAAGPVRPARHTGSVDVFLEAIGRAHPGEVLVVDNQGRLDEGCVGDLVVLEAKHAGLAGVIVWGAHRDTAELSEIGLPLFSFGACAMGPTRLDERPDDALEKSFLGHCSADATDIVLADDDGALFVPEADIDRVLEKAGEIRSVERHQADRLRAGESLRSQLQFDGYLKARQKDPSLSFRAHLRKIGGEIEE